MRDNDEQRINARGLTSPGPRMMVEQALSKIPSGVLRVIVSDSESVDDLRAYFGSIDAPFEVDQIGDEYHILVDFSSSSHPDVD